MKKKQSEGLLSIGCGLLCVGLQGGPVITSVEDAEPVERPSSIVIAYGATDIDEGSSEAALRSAEGLDADGIAGIESFYYGGDPNADWVVYAQGGWLFRPGQFDIHLELFKPEKLELNIWVQRWEAYEQALGSYDPATEYLGALQSAAFVREVQRLRLNFRYQFTDEWYAEADYSILRKEGPQLSLRFGDTEPYRIGGPRSRNIVPSLQDGTETQQTARLDIGKSGMEGESVLRLRAGRSESKRTVQAERAQLDVAARRYTTTRETAKDDLFAVSAYHRKIWSEDTQASVGVGYTRLDGGLTGSRIFSAGPEGVYDPDFAAWQLYDRGYLDLENTRKLKQWVANANLALRQTQSLRILAGLSLKHLSTEAFSSYLDTYETIDWAARARQNERAEMHSSSEKSAHEIAVFTELRHRGVESLQSFMRLEAGYEDGDLDESVERTELSPDVREPEQALLRASSFSRRYSFVEAGVNWNPTAQVRIALKGYIKQKVNDLDADGLVEQTGIAYAYPGYIGAQRYTTRDVNLRIGWRPQAAVNAVTRVDVQRTRIDNTPVGGVEIRAAETQRVLLSQSLSVRPHARVFLMATLNMIEDLTETGASDLEGSFADVIGAVPSDYWQAQVNGYVVVTKQLDLQISYSYLGVENFYDNSANSIATGSSVERHSAGLEGIYRFSEQMVGRLGYQYHEQQSDSAAGQADYGVHLVKAGLQLIF